MKASARRAAPLAAALVGYFGALVSPLHAQETLSNSNVVITTDCDPAKGGLVIESLGEPGETPYTLGTDDIWNAWLLPDGDIDESAVLIRPSTVLAGLSISDCNGFTITTDSDSIEYEWPSMSLANQGFNGSLDVTATIELASGSREADLSIDMSYSGTDATLLYVDFPRYLLTPRLTNPDERLLAFPDGGGVLVNDPMNVQGVISEYAGPNIDFTAHPSKGFSMQWHAYYEAQGSTSPTVLYAAANDTVFNRKGFQILTDQNVEGLRLAHRYIPANSHLATTFSSNYEYKLGILRGDWYDAARHYREWVLAAASWIDQPKHLDPDYSQTVLEARLFANFPGAGCGDPKVLCDEDECRFQAAKWDFGSHANNLAVIADLKNVFGISNTVPARIDRWDYQSRAAIWGDWFPARQEFTNVAQLAGADGFYPYFNTRRITDQSGWFDLDEVFLAKPQGGAAERASFGSFERCVPPDVSCELGTCLTTNEYELCLASSALTSDSDYFVESILELAEAMQEQSSTESNLQGLYLDAWHNQNGAGECYDAGHGHSVGGGSYLSDAYAATVDTLRDELFLEWGLADLGIHTEGYREDLVGVADYCLWDTHFVLPESMLAPLFDVVYHDYRIVTAHNSAGPAPAGEPFDAEDGTGWLSARRTIAAQKHFGFVEEFTGNGGLTAFMANPPAGSEPFYDYIEMIQNYLAIMNDDQARRFFNFGERRRDPYQVNNPPLSLSMEGTECGDAFITSASGLSAFFPLGYEQPYVYTSAWVREPLASFGDDRKAVGIAMFNWTDSDDKADFLDVDCTTAPPATGNQVVSLRMNLSQQYDLEVGASHTIFLLFDAGNGVESFPIDCNFIVPSGVATLHVPIAERNVVFFYIEPNEPGVCPDDWCDCINLNANPDCGTAQPTPACFDADPAMLQLETFRKAFRAL